MTCIVCLTNSSRKARSWECMQLVCHYSNRLAKIVVLLSQTRLYKSLAALSSILRERSSNPPKRLIENALSSQRGNSNGLLWTLWQGYSSSLSCQEYFERALLPFKSSTQFIKISGPHPFWVVKMTNIRRPTCTQCTVWRQLDFHNKCSPLFYKTQNTWKTRKVAKLFLHLEKKCTSKASKPEKHEFQQANFNRRSTLIHSKQLHAASK